MVAGCATERPISLLSKLTACLAHNAWMLLWPRSAFSGLSQDEVKALGRLNTGFFLVGFLGFLTTWILDMIYMFLRKTAVKQPNEIIKALFSAFAPQYLLSRSLYDISQTYLEASGRPNADPFTYAVTGRAFLLLALQAAGGAFPLSFSPTSGWKAVLIVTLICLKGAGIPFSLCLPSSTGRVAECCLACSMGHSLPSLLLVILLLFIILLLALYILYCCGQPMCNAACDKTIPLLLLLVPQK